MILKSPRFYIRLFVYSLLCCGALLTAGFLILGHLHFDDYRTTIENRLSTILQQQVSIGSLSLTYNDGVAIKLSNVVLGQRPQPELTAAEILATLKLRPLLEKRIVLSRISLQKPQMYLRLPLPSADTDKTSRVAATPLLVNMVTVSNGTVVIERLNPGEAIQSFQISRVNAQLENWSTSDDGELLLSGHLPAQDADVVVRTNLPGIAKLQDWQQAPFASSIQIKNLSLHNEAVLSRIKESPGLLKINFNLSGIPASGATVSATVSKLTSATTTSELLDLAGVWEIGQDRHSVQNLSGSLLGIPVTGNLALQNSSKGPLLKGNLGVRNLQVTAEQLAPWFPGQQLIQHASLDSLQLSFVQYVTETEQPLSFPAIKGELSLSELIWTNKQTPPLTGLTAAFSLNRNELKIERGTIHSRNSQLTLRGRIDAPFTAPDLDLHIRARIAMADLAENLKLPEWCKVAGQASATLHLGGALKTPDFSLLADFSNLSVAAPPYFEKSAPEQTLLTLFGHMKHDGLVLDSFNLELNNNKLVDGQLELTTTPAMHYNFTLKPVALATLTPYSALLDKLQAEGAIGLQLQQQDEQISGQITLDRIGAHLTDLIGKLNNTSGSVYFNNAGLSFTSLQAQLGESPLFVSGNLKNWQQPELQLDVMGSTVRAQDLIFRNQELTLYDLNGHLRINGTGIYFEPVNVKLEQGTAATVTGFVTDFSNPQVELDISGPKVDVMDVINLFVGPHKLQDHPPRADSKPIVIKVSAEQGIIHGLRFQNAHGLITNTPGLFVLSPLQFTSGAGEATARVVFDSRAEQGILRVSGHAKNFAASTLHNDLFKRPGLLKGTLDGDFYIEGELSDGQFWPQATGGIHLEIKEGVLHKFHSLAKVFSLLNVSQLFKGELPDMNKEGMPFDTLDTSVTIDEGRLWTENLRIKSEAMNLSMVGSQGITDNTLDFTLGVMPLRTLDKVITSIPIAGWILTGKNEALITAYFKITGNSENPEVKAVPLDSVSETVMGIFKRTFGLPEKLATDIKDLFKSAPEKKAAPQGEQP